MKRSFTVYCRASWYAHQQPHEIIRMEGIPSMQEAGDLAVKHIHETGCTSCRVIEKWGSWRLNKSFVRDMANEFGYRKFTLAEAYEIYIKRVEAWTERKGGRVEGVRMDLEWTLMNARNTVCKAVYVGILIRVRRGVYRFSKKHLTERVGNITLTF